MKAKLIVSLVLGLIASVSLSAKADTLVDTSSCSWYVVYSQSGVVTVYNSTCTAAGIPTMTKAITNGGSTCSYNVSDSNYYIANASCSSYSLYKKTTASTSSATTSSASSSVSACKASGKAGKYYGTASGSGVAGMAQQAAQYCAPCGTYTQSVGSGSYAFYCSLQ